MAQMHDVGEELVVERRKPVPAPETGEAIGILAIQPVPCAPEKGIHANDGEGSEPQFRCQRAHVQRARPFPRAELHDDARPHGGHQRPEDWDLRMPPLHVDGKFVVGKPGVDVSLVKLATKDLRRRFRVDGLTSVGIRWHGFLAQRSFRRTTRGRRRHGPGRGRVVKLDNEPLVPTFLQYNGYS